jgi:hypothetical protein
MEYNLLKTIENGIGAPFIPREQFPNLSSYPATDFVNPGIGQISRLYSFYVPLYSNRNLHQLQKKNSLENLEGSGVAEESQSNTEQTEQEEELNKDPLEFNLEKRKRMGSPVQESFLHPKLIKTDKIIFKTPKKSEKKDTKVIKDIKSDVKHKFKFT